MWTWSRSYPSCDCGGNRDNLLMWRKALVWMDCMETHTRCAPPSTASFVHTSISLRYRNASVSPEVRRPLLKGWIPLCSILLDSRIHSISQLWLYNYDEVCGCTGKWASSAKICEGSGTSYLRIWDKRVCWQWMPSSQVTLRRTLNNRPCGWLTGTVNSRSLGNWQSNWRQPKQWILVEVCSSPVCWQSTARGPWLLYTTQKMECLHDI